jgi:hypothetical protein
MTQLKEGNEICRACQKVYVVDDEVCRDDLCKACSNAQRAQEGSSAVRAFLIAQTGNDPTDAEMQDESSVTDLITDLLHYLRSVTPTDQEFDVDYIMRVSRANFEAETT